MVRESVIMVGVVVMMLLLRTMSKLECRNGVSVVGDDGFVGG